MPEIARFFGIVIRMYVEAGAVHHQPHFHAYYQDTAAVWSRSGPPSTGKRSCGTGSFCKTADFRVESHSGRGETPVHPIHSVTALEVVAPYTLRVGFEDATSRVIDFAPLLTGELYGPLADRALFEQVRIDPDARTLVWPNGADFDPATLHDWPRYVAALTGMARRWATA
jgi:hypothetical protein